MIWPNPHEEVLFFLLGRGLVSVESIVAGKIRIADISSRQRNFGVWRTGESGYFVKFANAAQPFAAHTIEREAACYWLVRNESFFDRLKPLLPAFVHYDPKAAMLVIELIENGESFFAHLQRRDPDIAAAVAAQLGTALGTYHFGTPPVGDRFPQTFPRHIPWAFTFAAPEPAMALHSGPANAQMLSILNAHKAFHETLTRLRGEWETRCIIHGDIKFANLLVADGHIRLIDWELVDVGDPCWDAGSVIQSYLLWWLSSIPIAGQTALDDAVARAAVPLASLQPALRAFWHAYFRESRLPPSAARPLLAKCLSLGAMRMLQSIWEEHLTAPALKATAILTLQASLNILENPQAAVEKIFGQNEATLAA